MTSPKEQWNANSLMEITGVSEQSMPEGALYVVGVPIGNFADITIRALWILSEVDVVAAEDTRHTRRLLDKYGINSRLISVREHNEHVGAEEILSLLEEGRRVAIVTDAGTPGISDPGAKVVDILQKHGRKIVPIPGPSAVITAVSASGLKASRFKFVGFTAPQAAARRKQIAELMRDSDAFCLYEAPHRIIDLMKDIAEFAEDGRKIVVARELTKMFEEIRPLSTKEQLESWIAQHDPKGEYAVVVDEAPEQVEVDPETMKWVDALKDEMPASRLAGIAAKVSGASRKAVYARIEELKSKL